VARKKCGGTKVPWHKKHAEPQFAKRHPKRHNRRVQTSPQSHELARAIQLEIQTRRLTWGNPAGKLDGGGYSLRGGSSLLPEKMTYPPPKNPKRKRTRNDKKTNGRTLERHQLSPPPRANDQEKKPRTTSTGEKNERRAAGDKKPPV